jgi:hypothetical protein
MLEFLVPNNKNKYRIFKITIALGSVGIASNSMHPVSHYALCSLCSYHFDMLRSFESAVGERGPANVPDLNFNSLKKHTVLCSEFSNKIMDSEKDIPTMFLQQLDL